MTISQSLQKAILGLIFLTSISCANQVRVSLNTAALYPTLWAQSRCRMAPPTDRLKRGDVVVVTIDGAKTLRRIVGIAGDTVAVKGGVVSVNDQSTLLEVTHKRTRCRAGVSMRCSCKIHKEKLGEKEYSVQTMSPPHELTDARCIGRYDAQSKTLHKGQYFLVADNRDAAIDSRELGPFLASQIHSHVLACSKERRRGRTQ